MASLHRDPRGKSPFWYCAFTDGDGSRHFKSTKETSHKKAQAVANGWQRAAELSRKGLLTQVQALKVVGEIYERANQEPLNSASTTTFLQEWMESKKLATAKSTARRYGDVIKTFLSHLAGKAPKQRKCDQTRIKHDNETNYHSTNWRFSCFRRQECRHPSDLVCHVS